MRQLLGHLSIATLLSCGCSADSPRDPTASASSAGSSSGSAGAPSGGAAGSSAGNAGGGAAPSSAGTSPGGAGAGAGAGGAAGNATAATPLFADDFEAPTVDSKWTERIVAGGSYAISSQQAHGGASALHVSHSGFSTMLAAEGSPVFPAPSNTFYGRVWLYVPVALPDSQHVVWIEAGAVENDQHEVRIGMNLGALQVNLYHQGEVDLRAPSAPLEADTWHCIEFKMGNDELELWLDGARIDELSTTDWVPTAAANGSSTEPKSGWSPTYQAVRIGWELSGSEIFYDDVALSHARIHCQ